MYYSYDVPIVWPLVLYSTPKKWIPEALHATVSPKVLRACHIPKRIH